MFTQIQLGTVSKFKLDSPLLLGKFHYFVPTWGNYWPCNWSGLSTLNTEPLHKPKKAVAQQTNKFYL